LAASKDQPNVARRESRANAGRWSESSCASPRSGERLAPGCHRKCHRARMRSEWLRDRPLANPRWASALACAWRRSFRSAGALPLALEPEGLALFEHEAVIGAAGPTARGADIDPRGLAPGVAEERSCGLHVLG